MSYKELIKQSKKEKQQADKESVALDKAQDDRIFPVVQEYFKLLTENELKLGRTNVDESFEYVKPIVEKILEICLKNNVKVSDLNYLKQLILKVVEDTMSITFDSVNKSLKLCSKSYWGIDDREIDFQMIDKKLKEIKS